MRIFFLVVFVVAGVLVITQMQYTPPAAPPQRAETNGDRWRRMCAVEAGSRKADQKECFDRHALAAGFENFQRDYKARLRDAAR